MPFLPMTKADLKELGWSQLDFILITGDAYVDHPSFGIAIIARILESEGFKVGIIAQPKCDSNIDWLELGVPRLGFGISAGNLDSMVNHYTAQKKIRHNDAYSPNDEAGLRPDRATIVYCNKVRQNFGSIPIIIGGIEASMRRIAHYDFWQDKVRNPILADSKADILVYGMGEKPILEIAKRLNDNESIKEINDVFGTVVFDKPIDNDTIILPDAETCSDKQTFYHMSKLFHSSFHSKILYQKVAGRYIKHNIPSKQLSETELDAVYKLPFMRLPHPKYTGKTIPAFNQIKDSVTSHRGCMGGCNFCTIGYHQGKAIQSRSEKSILNELDTLTKTKTFKGTVSDIGGPSANMYGMSCKLGYPSSCTRNSCLYPEICNQLNTSHQKNVSLLKKALKVKGVNNVFVSSGIRFDLALKNYDYIKQIASNHTSGLLKLAPEHTETAVLTAMGKPEIKLYLDFCELYFHISQQVNKNNNIVPYIIVGHPGSTMGDAIKLGIWLKRRKEKLEQVQEFTPTPMTISTCMYYTELDFETGKDIYVPKGRDIRLQKALVMWYKPENKLLVKEALSKSLRLDMLDKFYN